MSKQSGPTINPLKIRFDTARQVLVVWLSDPALSQTSEDVDQTVDFSRYRATLPHHPDCAVGLHADHLASKREIKIEFK